MELRKEPYSQKESREQDLSHLEREIDEKCRRHTFLPQHIFKMASIFQTSAGVYAEAQLEKNLYIRLEMRIRAQ